MRTYSLSSLRSRRVRRGSGRGSAPVAGRASRPYTPPAGGDHGVGRRRPGHLPSRGELGVGCGGIVQHFFRWRSSVLTPARWWVSRSGRSCDRRHDAPAAAATTGIALGWGRAGQLDQAGLDIAGHDRRPGGVSRGLRPIVARMSPPVSANRLATTRTWSRGQRPRRDHHLIRYGSDVLVQLQQHPRPHDHRPATRVSLTRNSRSAADKPTVNTFGGHRVPILSAADVNCRVPITISVRFSTHATVLVRCVPVDPSVL